MERVLADTGLSELEYSVNLAYSPEMGAVAAQENLPMYLGMGLVFIAGYLIIYNIFQISVTADVQFYGKLKTLGTTTRQLKKLFTIRPTACASSASRRVSFWAGYWGRFWYRC